MNGASTRKPSASSYYDSRKPSMSSDHDYRYGGGHPTQLSSKTFFDGYSGLSNGNLQVPKTSPMTNGTRHSPMLNLDDHTSMHLLTEHALGDSQQYHVLSHEEVDELKRELTTVSAKIDATKRKLAIEVKIRDAASTVNRLDTSSNAAGDSASRRHRRSMLSRGSGADLLNKTDEELAASARTCEDLSQELYRLETRMRDVQTALLEHTAGVLQLTHKGVVEKAGAAGQGSGKVNGYGDSELLEFGLDDRNFYGALDAMLDPSAGGNNSTAFAKHTEMIGNTQQRLYDLNARLREAIMEFGSKNTPMSAPPVPSPSQSTDSELSLDPHIQYMTNGLDTIRRAHAGYVQDLKQAERVSEEKIADMNGQLREIVKQASTDSSSAVPQPPPVSGLGPDAQIAYLQGGLIALERDLNILRNEAQNSQTKSLSHQENVGRYESTLQDLWSKLLAEEDAVRRADGKSQSLPAEKFSIEAFASKVGLLNMRATGLVQQKDILSRQIQQQRELNSKSDSEKDAQIRSLTQDLESTKKNITTANTDVERQLTSTRSAHDQTRQELEQTRQKHADLEALVATKSAESEKSRAEMQDFEGEMVRLQTELTVAKAELDGAYGTRAQRAAEVAQHPALVAEVAELKEQLAAIRSHHDTANSRAQTLQKELTETIGEYEVMTKSSIEFERERETLESTIDELRDKVEAQETELSDRKVSLMGGATPNIPGDRNSSERGATSTSVLKTEFKKMMRETRSDHMRALRHEQEERRKLEAQLRALKKDQAPGKSSLSQSMTAS